jgi:two-component system CheB/CheR fusion protein
MPHDRGHKIKTGRPRAAREPPQTRQPAAADTGLPVVGIGASAGGLEACRRFVRALPGQTGMAFVLIQHLDPAHESMMAELLTGNTSLVVTQAADGMKVEREHLYVIPPGMYLSVGGGALHLSQPVERHGARLPVDFFLHSLAAAYGGHAICIILSGTGADGSLGLKSVRQHGGLVIAQDPEEAGFDGMPRSAIRTGAVELVLPLEAMPAALGEYARRIANVPPGQDQIAGGRARNWLHDIIDLLRARTAHDFTLYKQGTLERRIERRMAVAGIAAHASDRYLDLLRGDPDEIDLLARDLLINVTSFFRDPEVFGLLADKIIPDLVNARLADEPIRIWIAGCSTGEEAYSLAILFREYMTATKRDISLQFFASDVDPEAVASAREGLYPETISADVSPARLSRFFAKEGRGYRVSPELRASVVFTVQDVLTDPPFSRLDMISCRNLLIYLLPEAQARVFSLFHFALRKNGILLLGNAETVGDGDGRFEIVSKSAHLYRHVGHQRPGEQRFSVNPREATRGAARTDPPRALSRQGALAELCRRLVIEAHAPAAVLINRKYECLYSLGPTDRFLHVAPGHPTHDLFAITAPGMRARLRAAIQRAISTAARVIVPGGEIARDDRQVPFDIDVQPVSNDGEDLVLVCFVEAPRREQTRADGASSPAPPADAGLEGELEATRAELQTAINDLEMSGEEQKAINDEASSLNEELQSTNEELLTSKEELQSLNEELTALNTQLHEALDRQRTTSNDLQNVLNSTNVATIFLDTTLRIRFFTPATRSLFNVIPGDIGRPLADLKSLSFDSVLLIDARTVLQTHEAIEREIEAQSGSWFIRRILPYRTEDAGVEGVVITFVDSTERRRTADALGLAKREAELASVAKSRFLAAASHDLRQPLQTLSLMGGVLAKKIRDGATEKALAMVGRLDETAAAMSGMLNALLDITQIDAGSVASEITSFPIGDLLDRLGHEFIDQAESKGLALRVVRSGLVISSDQHLLGQMIRNILSNAIKYTRHGKILLGCRRHQGSLCIEIWDSGIGIPAGELKAIFEEYHQIDNGTRERNRGLGLGLSIVQRLATVLGHRVHVRSSVGKGSVFSIEVNLPAELQAVPRHEVHGEVGGIDGSSDSTGAILIVEDDPEVRELLGVLLKDVGHHTTTAPDGVAALALLAHGMIRPDLLLADYNLPNGLNGLQLTAKLRESLHRDIPVIILTGDMSAETLRDIARQNCVQLNKPVKVKELTHVIQHLLPPSHHAEPANPPLPADTAGPPTIFVIDDDPQICEAMRVVFEDNGQDVEVYPSAEAFLAAYHPGRQCCLLIDAYLPGMNGLELLRRLHEAGHSPAAIMITGNSDVQMVVRAMKAGAVDFIEKPIGRDDLIAAVERALEQSRDASKLVAWREEAANHIASLTPRQREIMELVLAGHPSKNIAADLDISQRTVENHRAEIMRRTGAKSLPALARLAISARTAGGPMPQQDRAE